MIDRAHPEKSLLLLYGLPPRDSDLPHPEVKNFQPMFRGTNDPKYKAMYEWMSRTLAPLAPEYDVDLSKPAKEKGTTRPAGPRAAAPAE